MESSILPPNPSLPASNPTMVTAKKIKRPGLVVAGAALGIVLIVLTLLFVKGYFIAATVNGSPISRLAVIRALEKQGGKQILEALVDKKLIETELSKKGISVTTVEIDEEIKKIETQVALQGRTLQEVLASEGITEQKVREQITTQKKLEKILADKIAVSPSEIDAFIKDSKTTLPKGAKMEDFRNQISDQLKQQKFQQEAQKWVAELTVNAKIKYYVNY